MKSSLLNAGYTLDLTTQVWSQPDYRSMNYSDGDEIENALAAIIHEQHDLSVLSSDLKTHCTTWPFIYHLSAQRANLLRPFHDKFLEANVLEIGAGCGAITRYLGECGAHVIALEGSIKRAAIARARVRDLENVHVVANQFDQFRWHQPFDVITLIGVLEYANLFMPGENPALALLEQAQSMLTPNGILIIAIENQLGLKYFARAPEDHIGKIMYGIENRYQKNEPQTYGYQDIKNLIKQAHFNDVTFYAPFPDYKLPNLIVTELGFACETFDAGTLISQLVRSDPQLPTHLSLAPELVWPTLVKNKMALDLANSFLIVAQPTQTTPLTPNVLAYHFTTQRINEFCKETLFICQDNGAIEVWRDSLATKAAANQAPVKQIIKKKENYIIGKLLVDELNRIITRNTWNIAELGTFFQRYIEIILNTMPNHKKNTSDYSIDTLLPGNYLDFIPQNIIIKTSNGKAYPIDIEWHWHQEISLGYLLFRALISIRDNIRYLTQTYNAPSETWLDFFAAIYHSIGFHLNEEKLVAYTDLEISLRYFIMKQEQKSLFDPWLHTPIQLCNLSQQIALQDQQIALQDQQIIQLNQDLVIEQNKFLNKLQTHLSRFISSLLYRVY